jgi:hypothetical protein
MLHAILPLPFIEASISPLHLTVAVPLISFVATCVNISRVPSENTVTMFHIIDKFTLILVTQGLWTFFPFTLTLFTATFEVTSVARSITPFVSAITIRFSKNVSTLESVTVLE